MYYMRIQLYPTVVSKYVLNTPLLVYSQSDTTIYIDTRSIRCTIHVSRPVAAIHIDTHLIHCTIQHVHTHVHMYRDRTPRYTLIHARDALDTRSYTPNTHASRVSLSDASDPHPILANTLQIQRQKAVSRPLGPIFTWAGTK